MDGEEIFVKVSAIILLIIITVLTIGAYQWIKREIQFNNLKHFEIEATLLNFNFKQSTQNTHIAPIINSKGGMSTAFYTTGHPEKYLTIWDCGKYGRIISEDKTVFKYAQPKSILFVKELGNEIRIVGIKHD